MEVPPIFVGCAGWSIPRPFADHFEAEGSHLERYARVFPAVEINSSFYRPHKPATYERWAASVPDGFRFAVKVPRTITHSRRLRDIDAPLRDFLAECEHLGAKLGPLLVQLPPTLRFDEPAATAFFTTLRAHFDGEVACEPRHTSWFAQGPENLLSQFRVARVAADPALTHGAAEPGGWHGLVYYRLHGSPRIYYSAYPNDYLDIVAGKLNEAAAGGAQVWCIFDNTAEGAATGDTLAVMDMMQSRPGAL